MNPSILNQLMIVVEKSVRPVRAGVRKKDRIREEMLGHLTGVYGQELERLGDERAAEQEALRRFGEPAALTRSLDESLTREDRLHFFAERWLGWRPDDSAARYSFRAAIAVGISLALFFLIMVGAAFVADVVDGAQTNSLQTFTILAPMLAIASVDTFFFGLLYFKMRDAFCGGRGTSRSTLLALGYGALYVLIGFASCFGIMLFAVRDLTHCLEALFPGWCLLALLFPIIPAWHAWAHGPREIRHNQWLRLDVGA